LGLAVTVYGVFAFLYSFLSAFSGTFSTSPVLAFLFFSFPYAVAGGSVITVVAAIGAFIQSHLRIPLGEKKKTSTPTKVATVFTFMCFGAILVGGYFSKHADSSLTLGTGLYLMFYGIVGFLLGAIVTGITMARNR